MFGLGPEMTGGLFGLGFGILNFVVMQMVAGVVAKQKGAGQESAASIIRVMAHVELLAFPLLGYFLGPSVFGN